MLKYFFKPKKKAQWFDWVILFIFSILFVINVFIDIDKYMKTYKLLFIYNNSSIFFWEGLGLTLLMIVYSYIRNVFTFFNLVIYFGLINTIVNISNSKNYYIQSSVYNMFQNFLGMAIIYMCYSCCILVWFWIFNFIKKGIKENMQKESNWYEEDKY